MLVSQSEEFENWEKWKEQNKAGYDVTVEFFRVGNMVTLVTENLGINIKLISNIRDEDADDIYVCLTGDQVALTNINVTYSKH